MGLSDCKSQTGPRQARKKGPSYSTARTARLGRTVRGGTALGAAGSVHFDSSFEFEVGSGVES